MYVVWDTQYICPREYILKNKTFIPHHPLESLVYQEWGPQTIILLKAKWNNIFDKHRKSFLIFNASRKFSRK